MTPFLLDHFLLLVTTAIRAIEHFGAGVFLTIAVWCGFMEAVIITATVVRVLIDFARKRTKHAIEAVRAITGPPRRSHAAPTDG